MIRLIRIKKPLARKMYYSGHTIIVVPCKCGVNSKVARIDMNYLLDSKCGGAMTNRFDRVISEFEYYNCNAETGYYSHYYVTEQAVEEYNMCQSMCSASL